MSDPSSFAYQALMVGLFVLPVIAVYILRRLASREAAASAGHDPRTCLACSRLRHPSNCAARQALSTIPRQTRGGAR